MQFLLAACARACSVKDLGQCPGFPEARLPFFFLDFCGIACAAPLPGLQAGQLVSGQPSGAGR